MVQSKETELCEREFAPIFKDFDKNPTPSGQPSSPVKER
jgi:hypothetical protein